MPVAIHPAMGPMALVAAALHLGFPAVLAGDDGGGARSQLRSARQLQVRRERLEREALKLAQEEQHVISQTAASASG